nr:putative box c/d snorna protein [Quercus suber]
MTTIFFIFPEVEERSLLSFKQSLRRVDWLGLMLCLGASILIIIPLQEGGDQWAWNGTLTIALICLGVVSWAAFASWEFLLSRVPGQQANITDRTSFLTGLTFTSIVVYLPQRFQAVNGLSPVRAGINILPFLLVSAFGAILSGVVLSRRNLCSYFIISANCFQLLGLGLLSSLPTSAHIPSVGYVYQAILGFGTGTALISSFVLAKTEVERIDIGRCSNPSFLKLSHRTSRVICRISSSAYLRRHLAVVVGPSTLATITASVTAITELPAEEAIAVRQIYGSAFNWQWRILTYIAVANVPLALFTLRRVPKPVFKDPASAQVDETADSVTKDQDDIELEVGRKQKFTPADQYGRHPPVRPLPHLVCRHTNLPFLPLRGLPYPSYSSKPKYKCPRCGTQTCSLPCYKKHQQRAACNGVRDPASYLKKSQWATPAGIDQDYNYLRGVEQRLERASADTQTRGIGVRAPPTKNIARGLRPDSVLQRYLAQHGIMIERAPVGMSRQKTNRTRPTKRGNVVWSVEWRTGGDVGEVQHDCLESETLTTLYPGSVAKRPRADSETATASRGTKRKREVAKKEQNPAADVKRDDVPAATAVEEDDDAPAAAAVAAGEEAAQAPEAEPHLSTSPPHSSAIPEQAPLHFYLLQPKTTGVSRVLHPLAPDDTLTSALRHRTVQEYPTIYVLAHAPAQLPSGFTLASPDQERTAVQRISHHDNAGGREKHRHPSSRDENKGNDGQGQEKEEDEEDLDPDAVLEMLRRDITT